MPNRRRAARNPYHIPSITLQLLSPVKLLIRILDFIFSFFRAHNPVRHSVTIVCISDTHTLIPDSVPDGAILIHAGDLTNNGTPKEIQAQVNWLSSLPHPHKIAIAGNHDTYLDSRSRATLEMPDQKDRVDWKDIVYLQDSSIMLTFPTRGSSIRGKAFRLKIHGSPHVPHVGGPEHAFQHPRTQDVWSGKVPIDTDVLVTHAPPRGHLDLPGVQAMGDEHLLHEVRRVKPSIHIFGHIHAARSDLLGRLKGGQEVVRWDLAERHLEQVLLRQSPETIYELLLELWNLVIWYHFVGFVFHSIRGLLWERLFGSDGPPSTRMVNAALMYCDEGRLGNAPQVVHL